MKKSISKFIFLFLNFILVLNSFATFKCDLKAPLSLNKKSFDYCSQSQLDVFYKNLAAGTRIPNGVYDGRVQVAANKTMLSTPNPISEIEELLLERLWRGKVFYRQNSDEGYLFNRIFKNGHAFPAHVFFGKSLFDGTKDSVIIDYSYNQDIPGYNSKYDWLVNEAGAGVRDEIREVNSNLYLGRAYLKGKFFINFILQIKE